MIKHEDGKFTDGELLANMTEELDAKCVANENDDYTKKVYYHNGAYTEYDMDVKELENPYKLLK